jgi:hypothetical protein
LLRGVLPPADQEGGDKRVEVERLATPPGSESTSGRSSRSSGGRPRLQVGAASPPSLRERFTIRLDPVSDENRAPALAAVEVTPTQPPSLTKPARQKRTRESRESCITFR